MEPLYIEMFNKSDIVNAGWQDIETPPTQSQLQKLFKNLKPYRNKSNLDLLSEMRIALGHAGCSSCLQQQSMEGLWLIAYMFKAYNKRWNLNKKEWE